MPASRASDLLLGLRYRSLVFVASFLLFEIELVMGRLLLPRYGSSASVWMTCLMFYQGALFAGYLWGERAVRWIGQGRYRFVHVGLALLPAVVFPFRLHTPALSPILSVSIALALSVGFPFLVLSTTSVVAQSWFAHSAHADAKNPWFLYGVSNVGALLALGCYPLLIEPSLTLGVQLWLWYAGYALFVLLCLAAVPPRRSNTPEATAPSAPWAPTPRAQRLSWLWMPMGANALLMAGTRAVTLDASVPLLWVVPLAVYLVTLIIAFGRRTPSSRTVHGLCVAALLLALAALFLVKGHLSIQWAYVAMHSAVLFVGCLLVHWHLVRSRPSDVRELGRFYLSMSLGGWLGALAIGFGVPVLFRHVGLAYLDYAVAGALLLLGFLSRDAARIGAFLRARPGASSAFAVGLGCLGMLGGVAVTAPRSNTRPVEGSRTFYGLYSIKDQDGLRWFHHGNTVHGVESLDPAEAGSPRAYFGSNSPIASVLQQSGPHRRVAVIGLGVGSLAAYSRPGERWDFYELDPEVERLARAHFHFLADAQADVHVVIGDARLTLADAPDASYDLLIVDAFSSDFVPTHLITREALQLYERKLRNGGLLICHISNRIFDLAPVLTRLGDSLRLHTAHKFSAMPDEKALDRGFFESHWFAITPQASTASWLAGDLGWQPTHADARLRARRPWTDDYVNLFHALGQ